MSRENYREATVMDENDVEWLVQGKNTNRSVNGDHVAIEPLPESEWSAPEKVRLVFV